jgi:hypothetical protein
MRTTDAVAAILCATIFASGAVAGEPPPTEAVAALELPARVRLTTTDGRRQTLELLRVEPAGLVVRRPGREPEPPFTVSLSEVTTAERSRGHGRRWGALGGALVLGLALGAVVSAGCGPGDECNVGYLLILPAAAVGAGVGALAMPESWSPLDVGQPGAAPARRGAFDRPRPTGPRAAFRFTVRF